MCQCSREGKNFESFPKILTEDKSWRTWKSNQNIVMNEELVQHVAMGTKIVKNFVMGAKIDPKVEMDPVHIRTWTLDIIPSSSLFLAGHSAQCFRASLRLLLEECQSLDVYARAVRTWKSGHYFYVPSLAGLLLRNAWLDSGYMCLYSSWRRFSSFFYMLE